MNDIAQQVDKKFLDEANKKIDSLTEELSELENRLEAKRMAFRYWSRRRLYYASRVRNRARGMID